jgi:hypothetical protein
MSLWIQMIPGMTSLFGCIFESFHLVVVDYILLDVCWYNTCRFPYVVPRLFGTVTASRFRPCCGWMPTSSKCPTPWIWDCIWLFLVSVLFRYLRDLETTWRFVDECEKYTECNLCVCMYLVLDSWTPWWYVLAQDKNVRFETSCHTVHMVVEVICIDN